MKCKDAKVMFGAWSDGELVQEKLKLFQDHLDTCNACAEQAEALQRLVYCLDTTPPARPSPELRQRTMARFMEESGTLDLAFWWHALGWKLQTAMASGALIGLAVGCQLGGDWTGAQMVAEYSISGFLFSAGGLFLSWA